MNSPDQTPAIVRSAGGVPVHDSALYGLVVRAHEHNAAMGAIQRESALRGELLARVISEFDRIDRLTTASHPHQWDPPEWWAAWAQLAKEARELLSDSQRAQD